jgi:hypothetical protein
MSATFHSAQLVYTKGCKQTSVADPDPFDTDPEPAFHFDTDPDPALDKEVMYLRQYILNLFFL